MSFNRGRLIACLSTVNVCVLPLQICRPDNHTFSHQIINFNPFLVKIFGFERNKDVSLKTIIKEICKLFIFSLRTNLVCKIYNLIYKVLKRYSLKLHFFGRFYVILVWSVNYHYISKNRPLKNVIYKKIKAYILNHNPAKFHAFSTMCKIVTKICLPISLFSDTRGDQMQDLINKFETLLTRDKVEKCKQVKIKSYFVKEK